MNVHATDQTVPIFYILYKLIHLRPQTLTLSLNTHQNAQRNEVGPVVETAVQLAIHNGPRVSEVNYEQQDAQPDTRNKPANHRDTTLTLRTARADRIALLGDTMAALRARLMIRSMLVHRKKKSHDRRETISNPEQRNAVLKQHTGNLYSQ